MGAAASSRQAVAPRVERVPPRTGTQLASSSFSAYAADLGSGSPASRARALAESQPSGGATSAAELRDKYRNKREEDVVVRATAHDDDDDDAADDARGDLFAQKGSRDPRFDPDPSTHTQNASFFLRGFLVFQRRLFAILRWP